MIQAGPKHAVLKKVPVGEGEKNLRLEPIVNFRPKE